MRLCSSFEPVMLKREGRKNGSCRSLTTSTSQQRGTIIRTGDYESKQSNCGDGVAGNDKLSGGDTDCDGNRRGHFPSAEVIGCA